MTERIYGVIMAAFIAGCPSGASAQPLNDRDYRIEVIADNTGDLIGLWGAGNYPAIANDGTVVFQVQVSTGEKVILRWNGQTLSELDRAPATSAPGISSDGRVIAWSSRSGGIFATLWRWTEGVGREVLDDTLVNQQASGSHYVPTSDGGVGASSFELPRYWTALGDDSVIHTTQLGMLVDAMFPVGYNDAGQLAYIGNHARTIGSNVLGVMRGEQALCSTESGLVTYLSPGGTSISADGDVWFIAGFNDLSHGLCMANDDGWSVMTPLDEQSAQGEGPATSAAGLVAFIGKPESTGVEGLYVRQLDGSLDLVADICGTTTTDGAAFQYHRVGSQAVNDSGQVVFAFYECTSTGTRQGVAIATPLSACPGDIADDFGSPGGDGMVSFGDFLALLGLVGPCPGMTPGCDGDIADDFGTQGGDGMVSFGDFLALLGLVGPCA